MTLGTEVPNPTPEDIHTVSLLKRVIDGEKVVERVGNWGINHSGIPNLVGLDYYADSSPDPAATFVFKITNNEQDAKITFDNSHRIVHGEKRQGTGTRALTSLEQLLRRVVQSTGRTIILEFPLEGQNDTKDWLTKLQYQPSPANSQVYAKQITR